MWFSISIIPSLNSGIVWSRTNMQILSDYFYLKCKKISRHKNGKTMLMFICSSSNIESQNRFHYNILWHSLQHSLNIHLNHWNHLDSSHYFWAKQQAVSWCCFFRVIFIPLQSVMHFQCTAFYDVWLWWAVSLYMLTELTWTHSNTKMPSYCRFTNFVHEIYALLSDVQCSFCCRCGCCCQLNLPPLFLFLNFYSRDPGQFFEYCGLQPHWREKCTNTHT